MVGLPFGREVITEPAEDGMFTARADVDLQKVLARIFSILLQSAAAKLDHFK
jgi:hypothetical protein